MASILPAVAAASPPPARRVADLRSFMHGTPQTKPAPKPARAPVVSFAPGVATDETVATFLNGLSAALKERDGKPLLPRLAAGYNIDGLNDDAKPADMFLMAVAMINSPRDIVVMSVSRDSNGTVAKTEFRWVNKTTPRTFTFDATGKLLHSDFFALKRHTGGNG